MVAVALMGAAAVALGVGSSETAPQQTAPQQSDTGEDVTATTRAYDEIYGSFEPVTTTGTGDDAVPLPPGARYGIVTASYEGSGFFDVGFTKGSTVMPMISWTGNEGPYEGVLAFGLSYYKPGDSLNVWAAEDGPWRVTIAPISSAEELPTTVSGDSDAVFRYSGGQTRWVVDNLGATRLGFLQVTGLPNGHEGLHGLTGSSGSLRLDGPGPSVVVVLADGEWSGTLQ